LIAQYPAINHGVFLREVAALRETFDVYTASIRAPDRPYHELTQEEREESDQTYYIKPAGAAGMLKAVVKGFIADPQRFTAALWYAIALAGFRPKQLLFNLAYFAQAAMVGLWMRDLGVTHLHVHYSSTVALLVQKAFGIEISLSFHGPDEFKNPEGFWIREKMAACTFARAISHYARAQLMNSSKVSDWSKIQVVNMGVDPDRLAPRPFRRSPSPVEIVCVGRIAPVKAQYILIEAASLLLQEGQDIRIHIVGDGSDRRMLEREVAARGLEPHVIFHGFAVGDKLHALYRQMDIFALPSFAEGVPVVLMEAMAMEIPCVSTWVAGIPELIRHEIDGLLVAPSDTNAFAAALRKLIMDPNLRLLLGKAGRKRVLETFDVRKNSATLASLF
jgi:glycosyltransferase involved in cell wall biosynthesis